MVLLLFVMVEVVPVPWSLKTFICDAKTAVVFGASGLVGSEVIKILLSKEECGLIILPVRKIVSDYTSPKIKQLIIDFDSLDQYANELKGGLLLFVSRHHDG